MILDFFTYDQVFDDFEKRLFRAICAIAMLATLYRLIEDLADQYYSFAIYAHSIALVVFALFLYLSLRYAKIHTLIFPFIIILYALSVILWIMLGGVHGSVPTTLIGILVVITVLSPARYRLILIGSFTVLEIFLIVVQIKYPGLFIEDMVQSNIESIPYNMIIVSCGVALVISYLKTGYETERLRINQKNQLLAVKNEEIEAQNEELAQQREEVILINETLELHVRNRTQDLEMMNQKLAEYAFINAHILRAPVSRVKGLVHLLKVESSPINAENEVLQRLIHSCEELDVVLENINRALDEETALSRSRIEEKVKRANYTKDSR